MVCVLQGIAFPREAARLSFGNNPTTEENTLVSHCVVGVWQNCTDPGLAIPMATGINYLARDLTSRREKAWMAPEVICKLKKPEQSWSFMQKGWGYDRRRSSISARGDQLEHQSWSHCHS